MKQLCKIENEGKVSGVCAGLGRYFNIDVTLIRLIWILAIFFGVGSPILIYIILAIILPSYDSRTEGYSETYYQNQHQDVQYRSQDNTVKKEVSEEDEYDFDERYK